LQSLWHLHAGGGDVGSSGAHHTHKFLGLKSRLRAATDPLMNAFCLLSVRFLD